MQTELGVRAQGGGSMRAGAARLGVARGRNRPPFTSSEQQENKRECGGRAQSTCKVARLPACTWD